MKQGSAQRTERRMMNSIPRAELKSVRGSPRQIAMLVASASSQNKRQELIAFAITANRTRACASSFAAHTWPIRLSSAIACAGDPHGDAPLAGPAAPAGRLSGPVFPKFPQVSEQKDVIGCFRVDLMGKPRMARPIDAKCAASHSGSRVGDLRHPDAITFAGRPRKTKITCHALREPLPFA
jgi:hypothetical protein